MNRRRIAAALATAACACALGAIAQSTVYRWVDKDGKVQFSDVPPPKEAKDVIQKRVGNAVEPDLPYATQQAARRNPVTLYTAASCGDPCKRARELLSRRGVPYAERDPQLSERDAKTLTNLIGGLEVPVLLVGANPVKGYEEGEWNAALDTAGYPRSLPPGVRAPQPEAPVRDAPPATAAPGAPGATPTPPPPPAK